MVAAKHLLGNLLAVHAEFEALELDDQDVGRLVDGDALGRPDQAGLPRALVLVLTLQVLRGREALQRLFKGAGPVYFEADVQERVYRVALKAALNALHLQQKAKLTPSRNSTVSLVAQSRVTLSCKVIGLAWTSRQLV